jgi:hypothetical protein
LVVRITGIASERIGMIAALASVLSLYLRFPDHCTFWIEDGERYRNDDRVLFRERQHVQLYLKICVARRAA